MAVTLACILIPFYTTYSFLYVFFLFHSFYLFHFKFSLLLIFFIFIIYLFLLRFTSQKQIAFNGEASFGKPRVPV